jgi:hypothetical protein
MLRIFKMRNSLIQRFAVVHLITLACATAVSAVTPPGLPQVPSSQGNTGALDLPPLPEALKPLKGAPVKHERTGLIFKGHPDHISAGYVLIATRVHTATHLIDSNGYVVHQWDNDKPTGMGTYLLPNGNLLRTIRMTPNDIGNSIQELNWDGEVVWEYTTDQSKERLHHDIERLPNGNTLATVWERIPKEAYVAAGRDPDTVPNNEMWVCAIHEIKKTGKDSGEVIWRWSGWDHLIQNFDKNKANFGDPSRHPYLIDLNQLRESEGEFRKLSDWLHINSVSYIPERDEIILSSHAFSEMWVVSKNSGKLVYRWGNPARYGQGDEKDRVLYTQHDPYMVAEGLSGEGNILIFNNNISVEKGHAPHSSFLEVKPPLTEAGEWPKPTENGAFPPCEIVWEYTGAPKLKFYSPVVSSTQRLKNGGTLVCVGAEGLVFELDPEGRRVWEYINPVSRQGPKLKKLEKWNSLPSPGANMMFRAYKFPPDFPAFEGKDLSPKKLLGAPDPVGDTAVLPAP